MEDSMNISDRVGFGVLDRAGSCIQVKVLVIFLKGDNYGKC